MANSQVLGYSTTLNSVLVKAKTLLFDDTTNTPNNGGKDGSIEDIPRDTYNGFFKLIPVLLNDEWNIFIADGETWNPETHTSGSSYVWVDNTVTEVKMARIAVSLQKLISTFGPPTALQDGRNGYPLAAYLYCKKDKTNCITFLFSSILDVNSSKVIDSRYGNAVYLGSVTFPLNSAETELEPPIVKQGVFGMPNIRGYKDDYNGPFKLSFNSTGQTIDMAESYCQLNGKAVAVSANLQPQIGTVVIAPINSLENPEYGVTCYISQTSLQDGEHVIGCIKDITLSTSTSVDSTSTIMTNADIIQYYQNTPHLFYFGTCDTGAGGGDRSR